VAIDGSKIQGNASQHKAMSYERMSEAEKRLQAEVEALLQRAEAVDAAGCLVLRRIFPTNS